MTRRLGQILVTWAVTAAAVTVLTLALPKRGLAQETCPPGQAAQASATGETPCAGKAPLPMYERGETAQQTLLATRQRYQAWLVSQPPARAAVAFGPWLATTPRPSADADQRIIPSQELDPGAKLPDGQPLWTQNNELADGKVAKFLSGSGETAVYLMRTIRAERPLRLTVGIGGGDHLDVWLGGQPGCPPIRV